MICLARDGSILVDDEVVCRVEIPDIELVSKIDSLGEGFVLAKGRCQIRAGEEPPLNAWIIDAGGRIEVAFHAGDGIEEILTDQSGDIWIGYFDEAFIMAARVRELRGQRKPLGEGERMAMPLPGLIRWSADGEPRWYAQLAPVRLDWVDCYALNVGRRKVWAIPYPGFPVAEIDRDGIRVARRSPIRFPSAIAVSGRNFLFLTGDDIPGHYDCVPASVEDGELVAGEPVPLLLPDGSRPTAWATRRVCRDDRIWLRFGETWYVLSVSDCGPLR
ncbi:hypothetical protein [Amycolatopsis samaneae]|uniref:Uncharacterized protein n=1 Tax=Amycolatopsis samaneae TaxID=664691 RepID=A0ABW5GKU3_9PSEU